MQLEDTSVTITPALKGAVVPADLLKTEATLHFVVPVSEVQKGGFIFEVKHKGFVFALGFQNNGLVIQRNDVVSVLRLDDFVSPTNQIRIFAMWSHASLVLDCGVAADNRRRAEVDTTPVAPPIDLIRWVRKRNLIEVPTYNTEEDFREKVYSCLSNINEKIHEAGAYNLNP